MSTPGPASTRIVCPGRRSSSPFIGVHIISGKPGPTQSPGCSACPNSSRSISQPPVGARRMLPAMPEVAKKGGVRPDAGGEDVEADELVRRVHVLVRKREAKQNRVEPDDPGKKLDDRDRVAGA